MVDRRNLASQVADSVKEQLRLHYPPNSQLPPEKRLAVDIGVSRTTLRDALQILVTEGLLVRRHGVGTFVKEVNGTVVNDLSEAVPTRDLIRESGHEATLHSFSICQTLPPPEVRIALGLGVRAKVWRLERVMAVDGVPAVWLIDHVKRTVARHTIDLEPMRSIEEDIFDVIRKQVGISINRMDGIIDAVVADDKLASVFDAKPGIPLLKLTHVVILDTDEPVIYSEIYNRSDIRKFRLIRTARRVQSVSRTKSPPTVDVLSTDDLDRHR